MLLFMPARTSLFLYASTFALAYGIDQNSKVPDIPWLNATNQWQPPGPDDVRGPCPFLNTLANHGLVNRSGRDIDLFEMARVVSDTFDLSFEFNFIIASMAMDFGLTTTDDSGPEPVERINLDDLCQHSPNPGVDNDFQEHDSSLFRNDNFLDPKNFCNVDDTLLNNVIRANPYSTVITREELLVFLNDRIVDSRTRNPTFFLTGNATLEIAAQYMTILFLENDPTFSQVSKDRVLEMMLFERIPQGFAPGLVRIGDGFVPFFPLNNDTAAPLGLVIPTNDTSAQLLPSFLATVASAQRVPVTTCKADDQLCEMDEECCEGFSCVTANNSLEEEGDDDDDDSRGGKRSGLRRLQKKLSGKRLLREFEGELTCQRKH